MKKIYIAGKYDDENVIKVLTNIRKGIEVAANLIRTDFAIYCPFLDFQLAFTKYGEGLTKKHFQDNSMAFVDVCDAILMLDGWENSGGAKKEKARAEELGIPVCYHIWEVLGKEEN